MSGSEELRSDVGQASESPQQSRLFWSATALAITVVLLLCTALILIAAMRG
jgi:hypothetical protein